MRWVTQGPEHTRLNPGKTPGGHAWYLGGWEEAELGGARPGGAGPLASDRGRVRGARRSLRAGPVGSS